MIKISKIKSQILALLSILVLISNIGCDTKKASFSMLAEQENFKQSVIEYKPSKIDILWVIDNSYSMNTSQTHLANNFESFIARFQNLNYDFHMSFVATDGWKSLYNKPCVNDLDTTCSHFKDGKSSHSGVLVLDNQTPNLKEAFMTNVKLGVSGSGDERAFQSIKAALTDTFNTDSGFRREDAFLAIIIVSDEDDFSEDEYTSQEKPAKYTNDPNLHYQDPLHSIQSYVDFLDIYTKRNLLSSIRNYSVSAITIQEQSCATILDQDKFFRYPGLRYLELVSATGGVQGSLCDDFGGTLQVMSDSILEYSSIFYLDRVPINGSVSVIVDGIEIPNDAENGWTYISSDNAIQFHGPSIPKSEAQISINYDPTTVKL